MRSLVMIFVLLFGVGIAADARACQSDDDCDPGSHCEIGVGRDIGVCVNDAPPPPDDEQETVETPDLDANDTGGQSCTRHEDCGVGGRCVKPGGAITGTCAGGM